MFSIWFNDVAVYHLINIISGIYYWYLKFEWNALPWKAEISKASCWQNNIIVLTFKKYYSWIKAKRLRKVLENYVEKTKNFIHILVIIKAWSSVIKLSFVHLFCCVYFFIVSIKLFYFFILSGSFSYLVNEEENKMK